MKKKFSIWMALLAALVLGLAVGCKSNGAGDDNSGGTSSSINWNNEEADANGNWWVTNEDGLLKWAAAVNAGDYDANCTLGDDITLTSDWTPVGSENNQYSGTFDGNEKTISGLSVVTTGDGLYYIGFFGVINGATVKNLTLYEPNVSETGNIFGSHYVACVVAYSYGGTIENCTVSGGTVSSINGDFAYIGGIVGYNCSGTVKGCTNSAAVTSSSGYSYAGGIAGVSYYGTVTACINSASVSASTTDSTSYAGGIIGYNSSSACTNCTNSGTITGYSANTGGIDGNGVCSNCTDNGTVVTS